MYEYLDKVLKSLVHEIYEKYQDYRAMPFDELNVVSKVNKLYSELDAINKKAFKKLAKHYYESEPHGEATLDKYWLFDKLAAPSAVMLYAYISEADRKRDRLSEALIATKGLVTEYDKAMKYWAQMAGWFALEISDAALMQARKDDGVIYVRWQTEHDSRVCGDCHDLDNQIFLLSEVPDKPHPNCRCQIKRVKESELEGAFNS